ncbi:MAG: redoxin domain-containing protein [Candidatus Eremiobacteraeota bacterium]|nr:redoxin domain-containing protein [Candidatus Eremiobacteraeota bacterium]
MSVAALVAAIAAPLVAAATTLAPLLGASPWINAAGAPATTGRVTIVDVFTFDCINCRHVVPELRRLRAQYDANDLAIAGVHAPELPHERVHANVVAALRDQEITWPVLLDDGFGLWRAYGVSAWPTQLVFDRHGRLRATYVGEGYDAQLASTVHALVAERP